MKVLLKQGFKYLKFRITEDFCDLKTSINLIEAKFSKYHLDLAIYI